MILQPKQRQNIFLSILNFLLKNCCIKLYLKYTTHKETFLSIPFIFFNYYFFKHLKKISSTKKREHCLLTWLRLRGGKFQWWRERELEITKEKNLKLDMKFQKTGWKIFTEDKTRNKCPPPNTNNACNTFFLKKKPSQTGQTDKFSWSCFQIKKQLFVARQ